MRFLFLSLFFYLSYSYSQPIRELSFDIIQSIPKTTGLFTYVEGKDSIIFFMENGKFYGKFKRYHKNKLISSGNLANHHRIGRWFFRNKINDSKLILYFSPRGYVFFRKLYGSPGSFVWWGRGHIRYFFLKDLEEQFSAKIEGKIKIRYGTKEGKAIEFYKNTRQQYSISHFKRGLYEGLRSIYFPNGILMFQGQFVQGSPQGEVKKTHMDGTTYVQLYDQSNTVFFIDQTEIIDSKTFYLYIDTSFYLDVFRSSDGYSWPDKMDAWFKSGNLSTYADPLLRKIYFATSSRPDISGLPSEKGSTKNIRGILVKYKSFWLAQTWQHYDVPIALQWVSSYQEDSTLHFYAGPWIYLPLLYQSYPEVKSFYNKLQRMEFPFIYLEQGENQWKILPYGWIQKLAWEEENWWSLLKTREK
ncbi:MAG: hypothetical protein N2Z72_01315 [Bacteroidales bacterium]|nr:hypothetical protein [Bacteroidales bacterium]